MRSPDYALKAQVYELGLDKVQRSWSRREYKAKQNNDIEEIVKLEKVACENFEEFGQLWIEAWRCNKNAYKRSARLWSRIYAMLVSGPCLFLTFTFDDDTLRDSDPALRRRWVRDFCKKHSDYYIANIDYGDKNEREHYHAVIMADHVDYELWHYREDKYSHSKVWRGGIKGKKIHTGIKDAKRLAHYVDKLTNHAVKETVKRNHVIYGKNSIRLLTIAKLTEIKELLDKGDIEND